MNVCHLLEKRTRELTPEPNLCAAQVSSAYLGTSFTHQGSQLQVGLLHTRPQIPAHKDTAHIDCSVRGGWNRLGLASAATATR